MATTTGTANRDKLYGTQWADIMRGHGGNDYLNGQGGDDTLDGGDGEDKLDGGAGHDTLLGGSGIDALFGGTGNDTLLGGSGGDYLSGNAGDDWIEAGDGPVIDHDRLRGGDGNDTLVGGDFDHVLAGSGNDALVFRLVGNYFPDPEHEGHDPFPPPPTAHLDGGAGADTLRVDAGGAQVMDRPAETVGIGAHGHGRYTVNVAVSDGGAAVAEVHAVERIVMAPDGPALVYVGNVAMPATGAVSITATAGADTYIGGADAETVNLLGGNDAVIMNLGADRITTGDGADTVTINKFYNGMVTGTVTDFDTAHDHLELIGFADGEVRFREQAGTGTWIEAPGEAQVLLEGVYSVGGFDFV